MSTRFATLGLLILGLGSLASALAQEVQGQDENVVHFFVSPHPDDWQLFMNPNAYHAVAAGGPVVFLHTTAGEAGNGMGNDGYALARENGSLNGIRFLVNMAKGEKGLGKLSPATTTEFRGKTVRTLTYGNTTTYFLRLPDGNPRGEGYSLHAFKSLEKFFKGEVTEIHSVDSSAIYRDRNELKQVFMDLVKTHANGGTLRFHIADTDETINPGDHSDHRFTSHFIQEVAKDLPQTECYLYKEYSSNRDPYNVEGADLLISAGTWGATTLGLTDAKHYGTWDQAHNAWIGRQYYRILDEE